MEWLPSRNGYCKSCPHNAKIDQPSLPAQVNAAMCRGPLGRVANAPYFDVFGILKTQNGGARFHGQNHKRGVLLALLA